MKYYQLTFDTDKFHSFFLGDAIPYKMLNDYDGKRLSETWKPIELKIYKTNLTGNVFRLTSHLPIFDEKAVAVTKPIIGDYVEYLTILHHEPELGKMYIVNVTAVLDCLDLNRSKIDYFDDGSILSVLDFVFDDRQIGATPIFRIKGLELKYLFVSEAFKNVFGSLGLTGLVFKI